MQAVGEKILVQEDMAPAVTAGGVHLPDTARSTMDRGEVLSVGSRVRTVRPGDRVLYTPYVGEELRQFKGPNGEALVVMREEQIVGTIEEE